MRKAEAYRRLVASSARSASAWLGAILCLALLASLCLTLTATPPPDPVLRALYGSLVGALRVPIQGGFTLLVLGGTAILLVLVALVVTQFLAGGRVDPWRLLTRRLTAVMIAYGLLALLASLRPRHADLGKPAPPPATSPASTSTSPGTPARPAPQPLAPSPAFPYLETGLVLLGAAALLAAFFWRPRRPAEPGIEPDERAQFEAVRRRLELGDQIRDAIIACYAGMCDIFTRRMPAGAASLTAREFSAYLRARGVGEPEILTLTAVFEKARYSDLACDEHDRAAALEALRVIEAHHGRQEGSP